MDGKNLSNLTPREIVSELDRFIIGQGRAKKIVAIALRNRWRRAQVADETLREEILPKNIMMSGPTGVGKTEIARRLAQIADSPFIKVEATKFTEVGYVGRDVESMIKDLVKNAIHISKKREIETVAVKAREISEEMVLDLLKIPRRSDRPEDPPPTLEEHRKLCLIRLRKGEFDKQMVTITTEDKALPIVEITAGLGPDDADSPLKDIVSNMFPSMKKERKMSAAEALTFLTDQESQKMIDMDRIRQEALRWTENSGIIFIDEIDKIVGKEASRGPDVSREGVQRDFLPILEGSTVVTKYGSVKTDHILFIAAGAFHMGSPTDLIPELQGRFPLSVSLNPLTRSDFRKILTEPENSLVKQYVALLETEKISINFTESGIEEIARISYELNNRTQDIGARRLQTVMETLLEDISFQAPDLIRRKVNVDEKFVEKTFKREKEKEWLSNYIL